MALILKGNAMHPLASKFIVGNPISPKQVYNVFMGGGLPGVDTGFFPLGMDTGFFSLGGGYQGWILDFSIGRGGGGGYQGWIRDFSIEGWGVTKPSGSKNDYNNMCIY